jgi:hypothetical protein
MGHSSHISELDPDSEWQIRDIGHYGPLLPRINRGFVISAHLIVDYTLLWDTSLYRKRSDF